MLRIAMKVISKESKQKLIKLLRKALELDFEDEQNTTDQQAELSSFELSS